MSVVEERRENARVDTTRTRTPRAVALRKLLLFERRVPELEAEPPTMARAMESLDLRVLAVSAERRHLASSVEHIVCFLSCGLMGIQRPLERLYILLLVIRRSRR